MRLLRVIASMNPAKGGPCQGIRNSIPELEKQLVHNEVVCLDARDAPFLDNDPFMIHALGPGRTPWCYSHGLMPWLLANLHRFDAVILHGLWLYPGYAVKEALRILKNQQRALPDGGRKLPRLFVMPHGMLDPYFQRASSRKLKALRNWIYWKLIEGKVVNEAAGLLFTCQAELQLARVPFRPYKPQQEINVGYGIAEPPSFLPRMYNSFLELCPELKHHSYILFLSRIHEKKGVDLLIRAYAETAKKFARLNTPECMPGSTTGRFSGDSQNAELPKLVIAGPGGDTLYGQKIKKMISECPALRHAIFLPGMLTGDVKWGAFYGCQAFVLPSHQENFGIAVVEAMACSKPVLISNQVNIWQEIIASGGGMVAEDTQMGTEKMLECWARLPSAKQLAMGDDARETFERYFAIGPAATRLCHVMSTGKVIPETLRKEKR